MESILISIKKMLGIAADYTHFDTDLIIHINSVFMTLSQIGVGPKTPVSISGETDTWTKSFSNLKNVEAVKTYVYLKVRMLFDPPSSSFVLESMTKQANELEWRLNVQAETREEE